MTTNVKTDRELLELAAKAAGIDPVLANPIEFSTGTEYYWNPLTDDGDALRLANRLDLYIERGTGPSADAGQASWVMFESEHYAEHGGDADAATRRAIVRAAAAIGEAMP